MTVYFSTFRKVAPEETEETAVLASLQEDRPDPMAWRDFLRPKKSPALTGPGSRALQAMCEN